jgi:hypothetical protein
LFSYDYNKFKPYIAQAAKEATGRDLRLEGDLTFRLGFTPALVVENISFQNAPWGSRPEMARIKRFELEVSLLPLLTRDIQINRFRLIEPDILLEIDKDGISNLSFEIPQEPKKPESKGKKKDEKIAFPGFLVRELLIERGRLAYRDARSPKTYALALDRLAIGVEKDKPVEMKGSGSYNRVPFSFAAQAGSFEALTGRQKECPLSLKAEAAETNLSLEGTVRDLLGGRGFQLTLTLKSTDPGKLSPLMGTAVPLQGPLEISGRITDTAPRVYRIAGMKMLFGKSDLQGDAEINLAGPRPRLKGNISSRLLDLRSLVPPTARAEVKPAKGEPPPKKSAKVFPRDPLPVDFLRTLDAEVNISAEKVLVPHLVLEKMRGEVRLQEGALALKPLRAAISGGSLDGDVHLRAQGNEAALISVLKIDQFDAGSFLKEFGAAYPFEGKVDMFLDVRGKGNSIATLMGSLSGKTRTILKKGRLDRRYIDLLGAEGSGEFLRLLNPFKQQAENLELNCFVNSFDIKNGLAKSMALALDTGYFRAVGEGVVNLQTEELDFVFKPVPKSTLKTKVGTEFNLEIFSTPLRLTGTLAQPTLELSAAGASAVIGKIIGGELAGLAGSFSRVGEKSEQDFCLAAIEKSKGDEKDPPAKKGRKPAEKTSPETKSPAGQAEDALRKIFGR